MTICCLHFGYSQNWVCHVNQPNQKLNSVKVNRFRFTYFFKGWYCMAKYHIEIFDDCLSKQWNGSGGWPCLPTKDSILQPSPFDDQMVIYFFELRILIQPPLHNQCSLSRESFLQVIWILQIYLLILLPLLPLLITAKNV